MGGPSKKYCFGMPKFRLNIRFGHAIQLNLMSHQWYQSRITLSARARGFHLVTDEILRSIPKIDQISVGLLHLFLLHTSASLTVNENADPDVRVDMETVMNRIVPEDQPLIHTIEGPDDMPAHVKSSMLGCSLTLPIARGRLVLGTWQGIYLCEHRNQGGPRSLVVTLHGTSASHDP